MPVNLNTATYEELTSLPISPEIAKQIIELSNEIGHFSSTRELKISEPSCELVNIRYSGDSECIKDS